MGLKETDTSNNKKVFCRPYAMVLLTLIPLLFSLSILYLNLSRIIKSDIEHQKSRMEQLQERVIVSELQARIETAYSIVEHYYCNQLGQDACKEALSNLHFDNNNYVWVHQLSPDRLDSAIMLVHAEKRLINQDLSGMIDLDRVDSLYRNGAIISKNSPDASSTQPTNIFEKFNEVCLEKGSGVVPYYWPKIVNGQAGKTGYLKVSYVKYFPAWNWVLGAGAYADHIDHAVQVEQAAIEQNARDIWRVIMLSFICIGLGVSIIAFLASSTFSRQMLKNERNIRQAKQEASRNEHLFRTLISHLPQKILLKDVDSRFVYCNEKYAEAAGLSIDELIGKTDYDLYPQDKATLYIHSDRIVIESDTTTENFFRHLESDAEYITRILKTAVKDETGQAEGVLCVFEDFTERIQMEEGLKKAVAELETSNQQLKEMQSQLVQNEKLASIGQLAAGIAHEINNPMGFVSSNFSTLKKYIACIMTMCEVYDQLLSSLESTPSLDLATELKKIQGVREEMQIDYIFEDIPELFKDSSEGMKRVTQIVKNLRDFSRIDQVEDFSFCDLTEGIQSTLVVSKNELKYAADVITNFAEIPEIYCNSGQLNQVFLNILVNAAQAIDHQGRPDKGTIEIKTSCDDSFVICQISDNGPGIPQDNLSRIFDPFFTTKPAGKGTGLGLNLSYDIVVNKHKGQLLVDSQADNGTTFTIKIPVNLQELINETEVIKNDCEPNRLIC